MKITKAIKSFFKSGFGSMSTSAIVTPGQPTYPAYDNFEDFAKGAYCKNELVYAGIQYIATSFAEAPLRMYNRKDDSLIPDHPLTQLFNNPNPFTSDYRFNELLIIHLYLAGTAFLEKVRARSGSGKIVEIGLLRPDRVRIVPGKEELIESYIYELAGQRHPLLREDVIRISFSNPLDDYYGQSPLIAALRRIATDNEATDFTKAILENRAVPGVVIHTGDKSLTTDPVKNTIAKKAFKQAFSGDKRGNVMFMYDGDKIETISMNMNELAFPELTMNNEARILATLGVPPIIIGVLAGLEHSTYSNFALANQIFHENTIAPLHRRIAADINLQLVPDFDKSGRVYAEFDTSKVSAFKDIRKQAREESRVAFTTGVITRNEARTISGQDKVANGDIFLQPINLIEVPVNAKAIKPAKLVKQFKSDRTALLQGALGRRNDAELWLKKLQEWAEKEYTIRSKEVSAAIKTSVKMSNDEYFKLLDEVELLLPKWVDRSYKGVNPILLEIITKAMQGAADDIGIDFVIDSTFQQKFVQDYSFKFAQGMSNTSVNDVRSVIRQSQAGNLSYDEMIVAFQSKFNTWTSSRAFMVARTETIRASNHGAEEAWRQMGIEQKEWIIAGDACPYCTEMDGKITSIGSNFIEQDEELFVDGTDKPLSTSYEAIQTPPLHPNCRCALVPVI